MDFAWLDRGFYVRMWVSDLACLANWKSRAGVWLFFMV